jgi:hypothetical protein
MSSTAVTLLIAGAANLLPALFFMFTALLGSNGMNSAQGGKLLGTLAVLLVLGWLAALWMARHLAHWGQARGWSPSPCWRWCPPWRRCCGWGHERTTPQRIDPSD